MSVHSAPYYWLICDEDGCSARYPDHEVNAYSEQDITVESATDSDWTVTEDGRHYCWDHTPPITEEGTAHCDELLPDRQCRFPWPERCATHRRQVSVSPDTGEGTP